LETVARGQRWVLGPQPDSGQGPVRRTVCLFTSHHTILLVPPAIW